MQRGIKIHSLEVTRYQCADSSTAAILEAIIQETTNVSQLDGGRGWSWIYTIWLLSVGARGWWASTWCTHRCVRPLGVHSRGMTISRALLPAVEGLPHRDPAPSRPHPNPLPTVHEPAVVPGVGERGDAGQAEGPGAGRPHPRGQMFIPPTAHASVCSRRTDPHFCPYRQMTGGYLMSCTASETSVVHSPPDACPSPQVEQEHTALKPPVTSYFSYS